MYSSSFVRRRTAAGVGARAHGGSKGLARSLVRGAWCGVRGCPCLGCLAGLNLAFNWYWGSHALHSRSPEAQLASLFFLSDFGGLLLLLALLLRAVLSVKSKPDAFFDCTPVRFTLNCCAGRTVPFFGTSTFFVAFAAALLAALGFPPLARLNSPARGAGAAARIAGAARTATPARAAAEVEAAEVVEARIMVVIGGGGVCDATAASTSAAPSHFSLEGSQAAGRSAARAGPGASGCGRGRAGPTLRLARTPQIRPPPPTPAPARGGTPRREPAARESVNGE